MKRVLVDMTHFGDFSGFGTVCNNLAEQMCKLKFDDMRLTFLMKEKYIGSLGDNVDYYTYRNIYRYMPFLLKKFDLWHATDQLARIYPTNNGSKVILTIHDLNYQLSETESRKKKLDKRITNKIKRADTLTYITNFTKEFVEKGLCTYSKPSVVIYQGLSDTSGNKRTKPAFVTSDRPFILNVGRVKPSKNTECMLDTAKLMPEFDFYLCGTQQKDYTIKLEERVAKENISNVKITGPAIETDINWMYANCAAFVFPSLSEGFGLPPLEAMCYKKPVVSSGLTSLSEVCGKHAVILKSFAPDVISSSIRYAIDNATEESLNKAREYAKSYTFERTAKQYIQLYRDILGL